MKGDIMQIRENVKIFMGNPPSKRIDFPREMGIFPRVKISLYSSFMLNSDRFIFRALQNIADRNGYRFQTHSYGWIIEISDPTRTFRLTGYTFDMNSTSGVLMARDKYASYVLLSSVLSDDILIPSAFVPCRWKEEFIGTEKQSIVQTFVQRYGFPLILKDMR